MRTILLAGILCVSYTAAAETITLMCRGDAIAEHEALIVTGRVVVDTERRSLLVFHNGSTGMTEGVEHHVIDGTPYDCSNTFIINDATYGMTQRCEIGRGAKTISESEWLIDRASGHLAVNFTDQVPGSNPYRYTRTAECSVIDSRPKF